TLDRDDRVDRLPVGERLRRREPRRVGGDDGVDSPADTLDGGGDGVDPFRVDTEGEPAARRRGGGSLSGIAATTEAPEQMLPHPPRAFADAGTGRPPIRLADRDHTRSCDQRKVAPRAPLDDRLRLGSTKGRQLDQTG